MKPQALKEIRYTSKGCINQLSAILATRRAAALKSHQSARGEMFERALPKAKNPAGRAGGVVAAVVLSP
jgi:hypothetical protein